MINLSIPILQIKTTGFNLLNIKTMSISIIYADQIINKENKDIEISDDVIIVFLKQDESDNLKEVGSRISISAINKNNENISNQIRIIWVKKGVRSSSIPGGSFVSEEVFNQTISNINFNIEDLENGLSIGGNRVYLDYQDGKYGINTNPERGADTFSPFKSKDDCLENVIFIDSKYDNPTNGFSLMTQVGTCSPKIVEKNPFWSEINILDISIFSTDFEKINAEIMEG